MYKLLDIHARTVFETICEFLDIRSPDMMSILDNNSSDDAKAASSCLDVIKYSTKLQSGEQGGCEAHLDRGLLSLIWSDSIFGLKVRVPTASPHAFGS